MTVRFELPEPLEAQLRAQLQDLDLAAKQALLVDLYRQERLTHHQLGAALGLTRFETDGLLKSHGVVLELRPAEFDAELAALRGHRG